MEILKIISVAIIGAIFFIYLKSVNSELSGLLCLGTGIIILILTFSYVIEVVDFFKGFVDSLGISSNILVLIIKITVIAYLVEFSSSLCEDLGVKSIGNKVEFAGRIIIFASGVKNKEDISI